MIYNIVAKVLYANGYLQLAENAFRKSKHLTEEDKLHLAIINIKLFQRYLDHEYIKRAVQILVELRITIQEANILLDRIQQSPELKDYIEVLLNEVRPYAVGDYDPLVYLIYDYFRAKRRVLEKSQIQKMIDDVFESDDVEDNIMKIQGLVFVIENDLKYSPEVISYMMYNSIFPLGYNPNLLPKIIKEKFKEIFRIDKKIVEMTKLMNRTSIPAIQSKIDENKNSMIEQIKQVFLSSLAFYDTDQALSLSKLLIFSLRSLNREEKNKIYEELNF
ncbi:MAG: hypothetical protein N3C61_02340 [Candidatus Micrarchaeota archaeon]|nr:hypothetical protein [Candidatus Micrarchaeota archaeon]